jgi:hypothetical protein
MSSKAIRIISIVLMVPPVLMLIMSAGMKLSGSEMVVQSMAKAGLGSFVRLIGVIEILSTVLFLIPKTKKIGFLLLCCYLGGTIPIQMSAGQFPIGTVFLVLLWVSVFLTDKGMFLPVSGTTDK